MRLPEGLFYLESNCLVKTSTLASSSTLLETNFSISLVISSSSIVGVLLVPLIDRLTTITLNLPDLTSYTSSNSGIKSSCDFLSHSSTPSKSKKAVSTSSSPTNTLSVYDRSLTPSDWSCRDLVGLFGNSSRIFQAF